MGREASTETVSAAEYKRMSEELEKLWGEIGSIREELKLKTELDQDLKERLLTLELRFGVLQGEIVKRLDEYREDHKEYLTVYKEQLQGERDRTKDSDAKKWRLIWILLVILIGAAGWDITGAAKLLGM